MHDLLITYLYTYRTLSLPTFGTFKLIPQNANTDTAAGIVHAPGWDIDFTEENAVLSDKCTQWFASRLNVCPAQATEQLTAYALQLKEDLKTKREAAVKGIALLQSKNGKVVCLPSEGSSTKLFKDVKASRLMRSSGKHQVLVGNKEHSMAELQSEHQKQPRSNNTIIWVVLIILLAIVIGFLIWNSYAR
ncbi:MAG: hypothetical protein QM727_01645 [Niabella sp.]